ncbi:hypothetical protein IMSAGC022_00915 [Alistipes sp.]|nr:hypothetical protein IMSAGC022_00915 [Alistipes sp.]
MSGRSCEKICAVGYKRREAASRVAAQSWRYNIPRKAAVASAVFAATPPTVWHSRGSGCQLRRMRPCHRVAHHCDKSQSLPRYYIISRPSRALLCSAEESPPDICRFRYISLSLSSDRPVIRYGYLRHSPYHDARAGRARRRAPVGALRHRRENILRLAGGAGGRGASSRGCRTPHRPPRGAAAGRARSRLLPSSCHKGRGLYRSRLSSAHAAYARLSPRDICTRQCRCAFVPDTLYGRYARDHAHRPTHVPDAGRGALLASGRSVGRERSCLRRRCRMPPRRARLRSEDGCRRSQRSARCHACAAPASGRRYRLVGRCDSERAALADAPERLLFPCPQPNRRSPQRRARGGGVARFGRFSVDGGYRRLLRPHGNGAARPGDGHSFARNEQPYP